jgi:hypothetical protein
MLVRWLTVCPKGTSELGTPVLSSLPSSSLYTPLPWHDLSSRRGPVQLRAAPAICMDGRRIQIHAHAIPLLATARPNQAATQRTYPAVCPTVPALRLIQGQSILVPRVRSECFSSIGFAAQGLCEVSSRACSPPIASCEYLFECREAGCQDSRLYLLWLPRCFCPVPVCAHAFVMKM